MLGCQMNFMKFRELTRPGTTIPRNFCKLSQLLLELFITLYKHITYQSEYIVLTNGLSSDQRLTHKNSQLLFMIVLHNLREKATVKCTA